MAKIISIIIFYILLILLTNIGAINAHELWIEPGITSANIQTKITAQVRVGQKFKGNAQYYIPKEIESFSITNSNGRYNLSGIIGDIPIFDHLAKDPGLQILSYHSKPFRLIYEKFEKFEKFLRVNGLDWVVDEHSKRGLPTSGFSEHYTRYAKALLTRGKRSGGDQITGMLFELVALKNPYEFDTSNANSVLPVKLFWKGAPFKNAQITVFEKTPTEVKSSHIKTDNRGIANVPVSVSHSYLLNAVQMTAELPETGVVWKSHWASLTFTVEVLEK